LRRTFIDMSVLPEGTVTLLFTDIEGSTRLLQELGEAYADLLTDQRRLLRTQFEQNGGVVVDTQGDAFFVAFRRARDAVIAAVDAQRALAAHDWSGPARPRVRIAIHTGEPSHVGEGFVGLSVHRAARICSAGHGGQVLLSATTRDLVEDHLPPGVALLALGAHRLKDLDRPETIAQLVIEGIPPVLTPLKSVEDQAATASPFAGQEQRLAAAAEAAIAGEPREKTTRRLRRRTAARARALDWRGFVHLPGHRRLANRLEGLALSIHSIARLAPREDLRAELRGLARAFVTAARDARSADALLRREDRTVLARRLAQYRDGALFEHHLRRADKVAIQIAALEHLAQARGEFENEVRRLEPGVRTLRARVFDARLDSATLDDVVLEVRPLHEAAEVLAEALHTAYDLASRAFAEQEASPGLPYLRQPWE
jgi:class 3 adenylate cyclase